MKTLFACTLLALGSAAATLAQGPGPANDSTSTTAASPTPARIDFTNTSVARITLLDPAPFASPTPNALSATMTTAEPAPAKPEPRFVFGGRDDFRWQVGFGFAWTRFRSSIFDASAVGVSTSLSYFTNDWFALEGNVTATFAPEIFDNEHVKLLVYGAGPKIAWRQRRWEPWLHGLVGGIHEQPKTAGNGKNGFSAQLGGGADFRWRPRLGFRLEADYLRSSLFSQHQDNFQLIGGLVFHF
jgi:outer membrane protein with beta-barrel domain